MTKNDGGPAFPTANGGSPNEGMTLRDCFASNAPTDEVQELSFRHLSRIAQEQLTGMKYPEKPAYVSDSQAGIKWQLAEFRFKCAVNAAIRYALADAMLSERDKERA